MQEGYRQAVVTARIHARIRKVLAPWLQQVHPSYRESARNLIHYLAMRRNDLRELQGELARIGLSSLGRAESHVLASVDKVLGILHKLSDRPWQSRAPSEPVGSESSRRLLVQHTEETLGAAPKGRTVRIMVTLPPTPRWTSALCNSLLPLAWMLRASTVRMIALPNGNVWQPMCGAQQRHWDVQFEYSLIWRGQSCAPAISRRKRRCLNCDHSATVRAHGSTRSCRPSACRIRQPVRSAAANIGIDPLWLATLMEGDEIEFTDARGSKRLLLVTQRDEIGALAECKRTAYLVQDTLLTRKRKKRGADTTPLFDLPELPAPSTCGVATYYA